MIEDLQRQIAEVKERAAAKQAKQAPEGRTFLMAVKAIDRASEAAKDAGNKKMLKALETARAPMVALMEEMGLRLPKPRGRRRKAGSA